MPTVKFFFVSLQSCTVKENHLNGNKSKTKLKKKKCLEKCGQGVASKPKGRQYFDTKKRSLCNFLPQLHAQKSNEKSLMNFWDNVVLIGSCSGRFRPLFNFKKKHFFCVALVIKFCVVQAFWQCFDNYFSREIMVKPIFNLKIST